MSRSGYVEDMDDQWRFIRYRGAVNSAIRGKRGQAFLKEMLKALDAMPVKRLIAHDLEAIDRLSFSHWGLIEAESVCAIGSVGKVRGVDMRRLDPEDSNGVASAFGIADCLAREVVYMNDEGHYAMETPEQRFTRMRAWVIEQIVAVPAA